MSRLKSTKSNIIFVVMAIMLIVSIIDSVYVHSQNRQLKDEEIQQYYTEWYAVYQMAQYVDQYINEGSINGEKYSLYVNQVCSHFRSAVPASELKSNMSFLLVSSYDPLFNNLANEKETFNREKAIDLLIKMNSELLTIIKDIVETDEQGKNKLLDQSSLRYSEVNARVSDFSNKYVQLVDEYFRSYTKLD